MENQSIDISGDVGDYQQNQPPKIEEHDHFIWRPTEPVILSPVPPLPNNPQEEMIAELHASHELGQRQLDEQLRKAESLAAKADEQQTTIQTLTDRNMILEEHARTLEDTFSTYRSATDAKIEKLANLVKQLMGQ